MKVWIIDEEFNSQEVEKALIRSDFPDAGILEKGDENQLQWFPLNL